MIETFYIRQLLKKKDRPVMITDRSCVIQITAGSYSFFWLPGNVTHMEVYTSTPGKFNLGMSFTHTKVYITKEKDDLSFPFVV